MRMLSVLLLCAAAQAQESLQVAGGLEGMLERYLTRFAKASWEERAAKVAAIRTPAEVEARQSYIRKKFVEELGGFPEKTLLHARITGKLERDGYRVEKLIYESQPGYFVTASVYVPAGSGPFPAVLGTAGHSAGGKAYTLYQRVWISLAKRGFVVLAFDPMGQGERLEYFDPATKRSRLGSGGTGEHTMAGIQCLLTGTSYARYELWDGIRGVDYLLSRPDVDGKRIAVVGNSGGGTQSAYMAVVEPRLAAAAPSCYLTSWEKLWDGPGPQDAEQDQPSFLKDGLDFGDYLIAFSPRPIKMLTAVRDFFPIDGARATFAEARRIFEVAGAGDKIDFFEYDDGHGWSKPRREATYRWLSQWLLHKGDEGVEPEFDTEPEANLNSTPTGQVATSLKGETVQSLNRAMAEKMWPRRRAAGADAATVRGLITSRLGVARLRAAARKHGEVGRDGYRIERIALETEAGITVPALAFAGSTGEERKPAVLYVNDAGKAADAAPGGDIEALVRSGHLVLAVDPRGCGESGFPRSGSAYRASFPRAMRAILVGKTIAGMQVSDLLAAFDYLAQRPDVDSGRIAIFGKGNGGVLALYAAALEPRIQKVACERAVVSYLDIARAKLHEGIVDIVAPGVLKDFDLPDVAAAIAPRPVWIVDPQTPMGAPAPVKVAAAEYGNPAGLRFIERPEGWTFSKIYAKW